MLDEALLAVLLLDLLLVVELVAVQRQRQLHAENAFVICAHLQREGNRVLDLRLAHQVDFSMVVVDDPAARVNVGVGLAVPEDELLEVVLCEARRWLFHIKAVPGLKDIFLHLNHAVGGRDH